MAKKRGLIAALAGDMLETLREDLAGIRQVDGMQPFVQALERELPKKRRRRATLEEKKNASMDDVAGAARLGFGGLLRALNALGEKATQAAGGGGGGVVLKKVTKLERPRRKRKLGPERD